MMTAAGLPSWPPEPDISREVAPGVLHLLAPNASSWTYEGTNSYVLASGASSVIVDPGCEDAAHHEALRRAATSDGRRISAVLLTHDHPDHSDGARTMADAFRVPIKAMSPRFADESLTDGEQLRIGDLDVEIIHTPGHSDDSLCLWIPDHGTILTGDTLLGARSAGVMGTLHELLDSLERLRVLVGDRTVLALPGHGPSFTNLVESADRVTEVRTRRIDEVRRHISDGVTSLRELTALLYPSHSGSRAMFAVSTVVSTITYLVDEQGERGIPDEQLRDQVLTELERYHQKVAEHTGQRS
jgi:glyoxylase-like metal-dependent hydrolase (beta-lactamase superfamily II)